MRDKASISILPALCLRVLVPCTGAAAQLLHGLLGENSLLHRKSLREAAVGLYPISVL